MKDTAKRVKAPKTKRVQREHPDPKVVAEGMKRRQERQKPTNKDKEKKMTDAAKTTPAPTPAPPANPPAGAPGHVDVPPTPPVKPGETPPGETPKEPPKPLKVKIGPKGEEKEQQVDPAVLGNRATLTAALGMSGAVTSVDVFRYGVTDVFDFAAGDVHYFIKDRQGVIEVGGTADWDSGTKVANL